MREFWGRGGGVPQGFAFVEAWRRGGSATVGAEGGTKLELENCLEVSPGRTPLPGV